MNILMVASEMTPFAKTGGLGDVLGALPHALARRGHELTVFIPFYRGIQSTMRELILHGNVMVGARPVKYNLLRIARDRKVQVYAINREEYFDRTHLYGTPERDYDDNAERFIFFSKAVIQAIQSLGLRPQIVHAHDWQTALVLVYLNLQHARSSFPRARTVFTIHNLAYQGQFEAQTFNWMGLPAHFSSMNGLEFYGRMNFMKGGIVFADSITTVSRRHAQEIQTPEYGFGLDGVLRSRQGSLYGIVNGADYSVWNPKTDSYLKQKYETNSLKNKAACKQALAADLGLQIAINKPLFGIVSRFAQQKGLDLAIKIMPELLKKGAFFAILGNGNTGYEKRFRELAARHSSQIGLRIGFDEPLAHRIFAGCDFFMMPSLYEPCGLGQLYALRYGTIPIVRATGGLDDTVQEWNPATHEGTGFKFDEIAPEALLKACEKAMKIHRQPSSFSALRKNAMNVDFSWEKSAAEYETLYKSLRS